jgi:hypothetical protein
LIVELHRSADLLGAHVVRRAEHRARLGCGITRQQGSRRLGDPEIEHFGDFFVFIVHEEDVVRFEVAMNDAGFVSATERASHMGDDPCRLSW